MNDEDLNKLAEEWLHDTLYLRPKKVPTLKNSYLAGLKAGIELAKDLQVAKMKGTEG